MVNTFKVNITKHAQRDIEHIFDYIANDSEANAKHFIAELEKIIFSLEKFPNRNPLITENTFFGTDYRHLVFKKYRIIYRVSENVVFVLRVIHGA